MKRIGYAFLAEVVLAGMMVTLAGAQSQPLGDYARVVRKEEKKESVKKYDNDNLPTNDKISIVGNAQASPGAEDANPAPASDANSGKPEGSSTVSPESKPQDKAKKAESSDPQKVIDEWKQKISDQKSK